MFSSSFFSSSGSVGVRVTRLGGIPEGKDGFVQVHSSVGIKAIQAFSGSAHLTKIVGVWACTRYIWVLLVKLGLVGDQSKGCRHGETRILPGNNRVGPGYKVGVQEHAHPSLIAYFAVHPSGY